ncbi:MAG: phytoene synthase, partial [Candidatus Pelagibacter sp.]|nr:phytoene synthase [Candidatus Pelagibacter sp.]
NSFGKIVETLLALIDFILLYLVQNNIKNTEYEHNLISEDINLNERI